MEVDGRRDNEAGNRDEAAHANHDADIRRHHKTLGELHKHIFSGDKVLRSLEAMGRLLGVDRRKIPDHLSHLAQALLWSEKAGLETMSNTVASLQQHGHLEVLSTFCWRRYDETPMRLKIHWQSVGPSVVEAKAKVLCVEHGRAMLLKVPNSAALRERFRSILVCMKGCTLHRVADSHNTQSLATMVESILQQQAPLPPAAHHEDLVTSDELATNLAAERLLSTTPRLGKEGPHKLLHVLCDVHKASGVARKTFQVAGLAKLPAGLTHTALSLRSSGDLQRVRNSLKHILSTELVILRHAFLSDSAKLYRDRVCATFLSSPKPRIQAFRAALTLILNSDWRQPQIAHICERPFCCQDEQASRNMMVKVLCRGLLPRSIPIFPKGNWCGIDKSLDSVGLCVAVHGLLFKALAHAFGYSHHHVPADVGEIAEEDGDAEHRSDDEIAHPQVLQDSVQAELEDYRRKVRRWRQSTRIFLSDPSSIQHLLLARTVISPQTDMMYELLRMSGGEWSDAQLVAASETGQPAVSMSDCVAVTR